MGTRPPEDAYRLETFSGTGKTHVEEMQLACHGWELLVQETESAGKGLSKGELKRILVSKLDPETKAKIGANQADKKVNGHWVEVPGLPELFWKTKVGDTMSKVSSVRVKEITSGEGRWKTDFHESEAAEFFSKMVNNKIISKGTLLQDSPWVLIFLVA